MADSPSIVHVGPVDRDSVAVIVTVITSLVFAYAVLALLDAIAIEIVGLALSIVTVVPLVIPASVTSTIALAPVVVSSLTLISKSTAASVSPDTIVHVAVH